MRHVRALCGLAAIAAAFGCSKNTDQTAGAKAPSGTAAEEIIPPASAEEKAPPASEPRPDEPPATAPGGTAMGQPGQPEPGQGQPGSSANGQPDQLGSQELLMGTFACLLGPVMGPAGGHARSGGPQGMHPSAGDSDSTTDSADTGSMSTDVTRCSDVAKAANVQPTAVYKGEPAAIDSVRRAIDSRLSSEGVSTDASNNTLAFYDKGVASAKEARTAQASLEKVGSEAHAMSKGSTAPRSRSASPGAAHHAHAEGSHMEGAEQAMESIKAHRALSDLYQFGRNLGMTEVGTESQALAWIIGVQRFMKVSELPTQMKPLVAEPLFSSILNVQPPAATAGHAVPNWNEYLATAARSVGGTATGQGRAVGGGPGATSNEKANLSEVARASEERMQVLGQQLPGSSELRTELDQTVGSLKQFEQTPPAAHTGKTTGSSTKKPSTPKK